MTDMHLENIIANVDQGPYIIDAETAFNPEPDFELTQTAIFSGAGAFGRNFDDDLIQYFRDVKKLDINGIIQYEGQWTGPTYEDLVHGFKDAYCRRASLLGTTTRKNSRN